VILLVRISTLLLHLTWYHPCHANLLNRGSLRLLGSSLGDTQKESLGGEEDGSESASEQNEPLLDESLENGRLLDMLKYLSS